MSDNLLEAARTRRETPAMTTVAGSEGVSSHLLRRNLAAGRLVIMQRDEKLPVGIGQGLRTKVNANIGTSSDVVEIDEELEKASVAERFGADTITDLSMGGAIDEIRRKIWEKTSLPLTTVPIYQAVVEAGSIAAVTESHILRVIRKQVLGGVSSIVAHAGFTFEMLGDLRGSKRIMGMVSKGGSFTSAWMLENSDENPFLSSFEDICEILSEKDVVLSLGNTMRSGCVHDLMDWPQEKEILMNAQLARKANSLGVQVIVEGMGGHVGPGRISEYVAHYKALTDHRPLFVAGPLPIETGVGYDHIAGCVGGALAAGAGADYLCYITPGEHLALPSPAQVREGVIAFKIAAHIGDAMKYGLMPEDRVLAEHRRARDWEGVFKCAIDGDRAREIHSQSGTDGCTMCGKYCAIAIMEEYLR